MIYFLLGLLGLVTGLLAGLFGISGGVVVIPFLVALLPHVGVPREELMHIAIGTSLASMCITSIASVIAHSRKGAVLWDLVKRLALGTVVGSVIGAYFARTLSTNILAIIFALFELCIGFWMFWQRRSDPQVESHRLNGKRLPFMVGLGISSLSALLGVGGGLFMVPTLAYFHVPIRKAVGTSTATSLLISAMGSATFIVFGLVNGDRGAANFLYLPAFFIISLFSMLMAPLGAKLAHRLPTQTLRRFFGLFLMAVGLYLFRSLC